MNIYWGSYWNRQVKIVSLDFEKGEASTDDIELPKRLPKRFLQVFSACRRTFIPHEGFHR